MKLKSIYLKRGKEESLERFHPWVFSGAIHNADEGIEEGDVVKVITFDGKLIGTGHYQIGSIAVRILDFSDRIIDKAFYAERLEEALYLRIALKLIRNDNNAFRLVHGEGDFLPGLVVDVYGNTAVLQAHSPGMHYHRKMIAEALTELKGIDIKNVYYKSETTLPFKAQLDPVNDYIIGKFETNIATENGLKFHVDWLKGQKTGFFVDQRYNRSLLEHYAENRKVLNMFCYTGGFSFYAMRGNAKLVHSVDSSAKAVVLTEQNVELNFPGDSKHRSALKNALRGYQRLNALAFNKIAHGGILFTFSCSQAVNKEQFRLAVFSAAAQSGRKVRILHQLTQPADHPINIYHPEGEYLKGLILYVE